MPSFSKTFFGLFVVEIRALYEICKEVCFLPFYMLPFLFLHSVLLHRSFTFDEVQFSFSLIAGVISKNLFPKLRHEDLSLFSSKTLERIFKPLIYFELISVYGLLSYNCS